MHFSRMNMFGNQQALPQQNQFFQPYANQRQFGGGVDFQWLGQSLNQLPPNMGGQGGLPMLPRFGRTTNGPSNLGATMHGPQRPLGMHGGNSGWEAGPQYTGGQGYVTPGYPPQNSWQPQSQYPMSAGQAYSSYGHPYQGYVPQGNNQADAGLTTVQPAWEEPKVGGLKGFISNLMAKWKR